MRMTGLTGMVFAGALLAGCGQTGPTQTEADTKGDASLSLPATVNWSLDTEASRIGFTSIKAGEIVETHHFSGLSGEVAPSGNAVVDVPLDQVETNIDLRNERMREMFFETEAYPVAHISTIIDPDGFKDLPLGTRVQRELEGTLSLHGVEAQLIANVYVTRIAKARIEVASVDPVIVYVEDFNLSGGLEALREIASLPAITPASPVTFTFVFEANES